MERKPIRIALLGYGKMGHELEAVAIERGHQIVARIDIATPLAQAQKAVASADVAIEFSIPSLAVDHISTCLAMGLPVVCGTTGWYDRLETVKKMVHTTPGAALFVAANYSLGIALTRQLCGSLAAFRKANPQYDVTIHEIHHTAKIDAPSGTAIVLANQFTEGPQASYSRWSAPEQADAQSLTITSERIGDIPGTHIIQLESPTDTITLKHEAKGRRMFACGAIDAAQFLIGRTGFYDMETLLHLAEGTAS